MHAGVPSHDTLNDVVNAIDGVLFAECFTAWVEGLREPALACATTPEIAAIDGKTSRRTHDRSKVEQTLRPAGLDWITALRAPAIRQLAQAGRLQFSLFDTRDMAEISSPDYPGERLVVCRNPLLAEERRRKRDELLALTEADLGKIQARVRRVKIRCVALPRSAARSVRFSASARWPSTSS